MVKPMNPSPWRIVLRLVSLPFEAVIYLLRAVFFPKEESHYRERVGHEWYDEQGKRHVIYYVYKRDKRH
jgi:hypothetical protein